MDLDLSTMAGAAYALVVCAALLMFALGYLGGLFTGRWS